MTTQRISLSLDLVGRIAPSLGQAFRRADSMFGGVSRRVQALTRAERDQREELVKVRDARRKALEGGAQDVAEYDRQIQRLNADLGKTTDRLRDVTQAEARRQRTARTIGAVGAAVGATAIGAAVGTSALVGAQARRAQEIDRAALSSGVDSGQLQEFANVLVGANLLDREGAATESAEILREVANRLGDLESGSIREAFAALGLDQSAFAGQFASDPLTALRETFGPAFQQVADTQGIERAQFLAQEAFGGAEARSLLPLITLETEAYAAAKERAAQVRTLTPDELDTLREAAYSTDRLTNATSELGTSISLEAAPALAGTRNALAGVIEKTNELIGGNETLAKVVGTAAAVLGGAGGLGGALLGILPALAGLPPLISGITAAWGALNLAFLVSPIGLIIIGVVAAIAALVAIGYVVYRNWDTILAFLSKAWASVKDAIGGAIDALRMKWNDLVSLIASAFRTVISPILTAVGAIGDALGFDTSGVAGVRDAIDSIERTLTIDGGGGGAASGGGRSPSGGGRSPSGGGERVVNQTNYVTVNEASDGADTAMRVGDEIAAQAAR